MTEGPLAGRRVVVTRAGEQADGLAERVRAAGGEVIVAPLIDIVDIDDGGRLDAALEQLEHVAWLVVTSPNGASRVRQAVLDLGDQRPRIATVGAATSAALGVAADLVPTRQIGEALVEVFPDAPRDAPMMRRRVLVVQAEGARAVVADGLAARGWDVDVVRPYRAVAVAPPVALIDQVRGADAVLFASGSAVRAWIAAFGVRAAPLTVGIGPVTAAVAQDLGLKLDVVATDHSLDGLVRALVTEIVDHQ